MKSLIKVAFFSLLTFLLLGCVKEDFSKTIYSEEEMLHMNSQIGNGEEDLLKPPACPQQTVPYEDLAPVGTPTGTALLDRVYDYCFGHENCLETLTYLSTETGLSCIYIPNFVSDLDNVTYSEQRDLVQEAIDIANANKPTCSGTVIVTDIVFSLDGLIDLYLCMEVEYSCCSSGQN
ncbi:MAG: hypothetical protein DWQ02_20885 [Bacteroidetes bacterium]|nr:MAG: hypothetical protein DWQ02_20885 [Bacteroidota bacterium]